MDITMIFITAFVYLICPTIRRLVNGRLSPQKSTKFALINSSICCLIFCILRILNSGGKTLFLSFVPAVTYFFIAKIILTYKSPNSPPYKQDPIDDTSSIKEHQTESKTSKQSIIHNKPTTLPKQFFCYHCGEKIVKNATYCTKCGSKIIKGKDNNENKE